MVVNRNVHGSKEGLDGFLCTTLEKFIWQTEKDACLELFFAILSILDLNVLRTCVTLVSFCFFLVIDSWQPGTGRTAFEKRWVF